MEFESMNVSKAGKNLLISNQSKKQATHFRVLTQRLYKFPEKAALDWTIDENREIERLLLGSGFQKPFVLISIVYFSGVYHMLDQAFPVRS